jgi:hypothetical protein
MQMAYVNTPVELAKTITGMSYAGLMEVARELVEMNTPEADSGRDVGTPHGMADTLANWAEGVVEEAEEEARVAKLASAKAA